MHCEESTRTTEGVQAKGAPEGSDPRTVAAGTRERQRETGFGAFLFRRKWLMKSLLNESLIE